MRAGCVQIVVSPQKNFAGGTELRIVSKALPILFHAGARIASSICPSYRADSRISAPRLRKPQSQVRGT